MTEKSKLKKEIREWVVLITVGGFIYLMGWHTAIIGKIQQLFLASGVIQPREITEERYASYDFLLEDFEGNRVTFESFKGRVVFINFWATWCPPCIAEIPDIHDLYKEKGQEIKFVMISLDRDEEKARKYIKNHEYEFSTYFLRSALPKTFDTHSIPTTYLLDKKGRIRVENHGMAKYNTSSFRDS